MVLHHSQDVFQIAEGIQVIRFRCFCDAVDDRTGFCAVDTVDLASMHVCAGRSCAAHLPLRYYQVGLHRHQGILLMPLLG